MLKYLYTIKYWRQGIYKSISSSKRNKERKRPRASVKIPHFCLVPFPFSTHFWNFNKPPRPAHSSVIFLKHMTFGGLLMTVFVAVFSFGKCDRTFCWWFGSDKGSLFFLWLLKETVHLVQCPGFLTIKQNSMRHLTCDAARVAWFSVKHQESSGMKSLPVFY